MNNLTDLSKQELIDEIVRLKAQVEEGDNGLDANNSFFDSLFEQSPYGMWIMDHEGYLKKINRACCELHKIESEEVIGTYNIFHDNLIAEQGAKELVLTVFDKGATVQFIINYNSSRLSNFKLRNFVDIFLEVTIMPFMDNEGNITSVIGVEKDITDQINAENTLKKSELKLKNLLNNIPDIVYQCLNDDNWTMILINNAFETITGYTRDQVLLNKEISYMDLIHPEDKEFVQKTVQSSLKSKNRFELEYRILTADGKEKWVWERGYQTEIGPDGMILLEGIIYDITDRKKSEQLLKENVSYFKGVFESSMIGILFWNTNGEIIDANDTFLDMIGYTREELQTGTIKWRELTPHEFEEKDNNAMKEVMEKGVIKPFEKEYIHKDGRRIPITLGASRLKGMDNSGVAFVLDISEKRKAEYEINTLNKLFQDTSRVAKIGGWEFDVESGKGAWTEEVARIHDLDPDVPTSVEMGLSFYADESKKIIEQAVQEAVESGKPYDLELELVTAKGVHKWVRTIGDVVMEEGKVQKVFGSFQDITDKKKIEHELLKHQNHLEELIMERTKKLVESNKELERLNSLFVNREFRIKELKDKIRVLEKKV